MSVWGVQNRNISRDCRDTIQRYFQQAGAHCRPNIERIVRWTLQDNGDGAEMDQGMREVEQDLAEVIAEIEGGG